MRVRVKANAKLWKYRRDTCSGKGRELDSMHVEYSEPLSPPGFFLGKLRTGFMRYTGWMDVLVRVFVYISEKYRARWKSEVTATKEQRTPQAGSTTTSTERRAYLTAHFTAARNPAARIYFIDFRGMRLTHSAVVSQA